MAPRTCVDHATTLASALYTERCRWRGNCDADHDVQVRDFPPFCDVLVSLGPGVVSAAHSCILASSSPVLKEKLLKEKEQKVRANCWISGYSVSYKNVWLQEYKVQTGSGKVKSRSSVMEARSIRGRKKGAVVRIEGNHVVFTHTSYCMKERLRKTLFRQGGEWSLLRLDLSDLLLPLLIHSSAIDDRRFLLESALDLAYLGQQQVKKPEADSERFLRFSLGIWTMQEGQQLVERVMSLAPYTNERSITRPFHVLQHQSAQEKTKSPQQEEAKEPNKNDKPPVQMDISFCPKCNLLFISKDEFLTHRMMDCTRKFTCKTCSAMFTRVQGLMEHLVSLLMTYPI